MKIVKLDKRFRAKRLQGHTTGIIYNRWCKEAMMVESYLRGIYPGTGGYPSTRQRADWWAYFEHKSGKANDKKYYITFRDENLVSLMILVGVLQDNEDQSWNRVTV